LVKRHEDLAAALPDIPRWVETRALLLSGRCRVFTGSDPAAGFMVRGDREPLICVVGRPEAAAVREAARGTDPERRVLAPLSSAEYLRGILPDWRVATATVHRLGPDAGPFPQPASDLRLVEPGAERERIATRLPAGLREELTRLPPEAAMAVAVADGEPAAVCYAAWETETLWDLSIDTLEPFRRRGLAARLSAFLIAQMRERGKEPVWGAEDDNTASLRLAAKLGFVPVDRLVLLAPPAAS
jgi:GNAT superfamily N-acetyltransferase